MLPGQRFLDADQYLTVPELDADRQAEAAPRLFWGREDVPFFIPLAVATDAEAHAVAHAVVYRGAWIVKCPFCPGAQYASRTDHRTLCVSCINERAGAKWLRVEWPDDVEGIEEALRARLTDNANTAPGETVADLLAENAEHGV